MKPGALSSEYEVRHLAAADVGSIYELSAENPLFYEFCPPYVTEESILADMEALPPGTPRENKYYIGFFRGRDLIAVMDLVVDYPGAGTAFIGLFMLRKSEQGRGVGSGIIRECAVYLKRQGYRRIRLAFAKGNPQSEAFWRKNGFRLTGEERDSGAYTAVLMERLM